MSDFYKAVTRVEAFGACVVIKNREIDFGCATSVPSLVPSALNFPPLRVRATGPEHKSAATPLLPAVVLALGRRFGELERRMGDVCAFADRVRIANLFLSARLPANESVGAIGRTAAAVLMNAGSVRVPDLADAAGLGLRQFERRFRYEIGMPSKLYARIVRFEAALRRKAAAPALRWTDIAHTLGYHDQMHMVHDFNRLSGNSPTAICGRLDMFVHPELASAGRPWRDQRGGLLGSASWRAGVGQRGEGHRDVEKEGRRSERRCGHRGALCRSAVSE